jgi:formylglycine-generating enzyme required for sulfatase activity
MLRHFSPLAAFAVASLAFAQETTLPLGGGADLTVVKIEPGLFQQGSHEAETGRGPDETRRYVTISRAFYLGKTPVTRGQFARFVSDTNYRTEAEKGTSGGFGYENGKLVQRKDFTWRAPGFTQTDSDPVVIVTWNDAQAFLGWLSRKTGSKFELPSEAQWEYACRAGTDTPHAGALTPDEVAWHKGNSGMRTHPVGEKPANAWGLTDMLGNVWEWCADWYGPYAEGPQLDPVQENSNLSDKPRRVLRGGSWLKDPAGVRVSARYRNDPQSRNADNGFRVMAYALDVGTALEKLSAPAAAATPVPPAVSLQAQSTPAREPSQPVSPPGAVSSDRAPSSGKTGMLSRAYLGFGCVCLAIIVLLFFVRRAFRAGDSSSRPTFSIPGTGTPPVLPRQGGGAGGTAPRSRIADDGFWVEGGDVPAGTPLKCRYVVGGANQEKDLTFEARPGGQFVYTGQRPSSVSIIVMAAGAAMGAAASMFDTDTDDERRRERQRLEEEERRRRRRSDDDSHSAY